MDFSALRSHLDAEYGLLIPALAAADPSAPVPTCPAWTTDDLARHIAQVYLHKAEAIRLQAWPQPWPPDFGDRPAVAAVADSWTALIAQLDAHAPDDPAQTWHDPDQTVGFWIRRMAQETVIHRIDAELAAGRPVSPIDADLAADTIDEVLSLFLGWGSTEWPEDFTGALDQVDSRIVEVAVPGRSWFVTATSTGVVIGAAPNADVATRVAGDAEAVAMWLWNRGSADRVTVDGDQSLVVQLKRLMVTATQ